MNPVNNPVGQLAANDIKKKMAAFGYVKRNSPIHRHVNGYLSTAQGQQLKLAANQPAFSSFTWLVYAPTTPANNNLIQVPAANANFGTGVGADIIAGLSGTGYHDNTLFPGDVYPSLFESNEFTTYKMVIKDYIPGVTAVGNTELLVNKRYPGFQAALNTSFRGRTQSLDLANGSATCAFHLIDINWVTGMAFFRLVD